MAPHVWRGVTSARHHASRLHAALTVRQALCGAAVAALAAGSGCGGHPGGPTPVPPGPPTVSCPAPIQALAHNGVLPEVTYTTPSGQGGQSPITTTCTPGSGTTFQLGMTTVSCTVTDALGQTGSCSFGVTVATVPRIALTKFMAFGDSMTQGVIFPIATALTVDPADAYPTQLLALLSGRYVDQTIGMTNEGIGGKEAVNDVTRFTDAVRADRPEVVLLLEGANDLNHYGVSGIPGVLSAFETMIHEAKGRGAEVFLATLPPQNPAGKNGHHAGDVPLLNAGIAHTAQDEGATLVDLYGQMGTYVGYIGADGLHPTPEGYTKIAQIWRDAIQAQLELPSAAPPTVTAPARAVTPARPPSRPPTR